MPISVLKIDGTQSSTVELPDGIFGRQANEAIVHKSVVGYLANQRQGTASTKTRSDVSGGGTKPWRQKGTGRARVGTIRSPLWHGGGIVFGPSPRDYNVRLPKKQKRTALLSVLSDKARADRIKLLENLDLPDHKTKNFTALLDKLELRGKKVLFLDEGKNRNPYLASRNIPGIMVRRARLANPYELLYAVFVVITMAGLKELEEVYG